MVIFNFIFSLISTILALGISLVVLSYSWWLLFLNKYTRYKRVAQYIITVPLALVYRVLFMMRLKVYGKEHVDPARVSLYICNHQSYMDIPPLLRYSRATALSKKEVKWLPIIGQITYVGGGLFFDRKKTTDKFGVLREVIELFKSGSSLCIFPEGTRSRSGKLLRPRFALIKLCYKKNIPVVPAGIEGTRNIMKSGRFYYKFFQKVVLEFTPPIYPEQFKNEDDFCKACWERVKVTHDGILKNHFE